MDGYEAIRAIRAEPRYADLPIVVLSAKAIPGEREKAIAAGADEYLQKPVVDVDRLLKVACDLLDPMAEEKTTAPDDGSQAERPGSRVPGSGSEVRQAGRANGDTDASR
jgi:DNA-binding response OmpR family regulator